MYSPSASSAHWNGPRHRVFVPVNIIKSLRQVGGRETLFTAVGDSLNNPNLGGVVKYASKFTILPTKVKIIESASSERGNQQHSRRRIQFEVSRWAHTRLHFHRNLMNLIKASTMTAAIRTSKAPPPEKPPLLMNYNVGLWNTALVRRVRHYLLMAERLI
jgi:hypothetical protein